MKYLLDRLGEASTWRGIIMLLTALGVSIKPELQESIVSTGLAIAGFVGVVTKDKTTN